jgi:cell division protein FtsI (penicillin-binding protein 3)
MKKDKIRLLFLSLTILVLLSILAVPYYQIQIVEGSKWVKEAKKQHYFTVKEPFKRGTFYSNPSIKKGHLEKEQKLACDIQKFHLYIDPASLPEQRKKEISETLIRLLDVPKEERDHFSEQFYKKSRSRKLAKWLDPETKSTLLEWWNPFAKKYKIPRNALFFASDYRRSYPFGKLLGQVLHTVQDSKNERTDQAIPTGGLELYLDPYLKGKGGKRLVMRSPKNTLETEKIISSPEPGADVYLTIDHILQAIVEEELEKGVKKCKAKSGWAVMMQPHTGEILALAQYPFFYPADYQSYFNDPELIEHTKVKAITDAHEPGCVMKPMSIYAALIANEELKKRGEKPLFDPLEKIPCSNGKFPGRSKPISDTHLHHFLNMEMGIKKSSNIYVARLFERIVDRLGEKWLRDILKDTFGIGKKTGIQLPAESGGVLPELGKRHPNGALEWSTSTPFSLAFGHNLQMTSLQLLAAYAPLVNGGYKIQPSLIKKVCRNHSDGSSEVIFENIPAPEKVLDSAIAKQVVRAMKFTTKTGGTCRKGDIWGYTEGGKTGTPEKIVNGTYSKTLHVPSFVGFAPADHPEFLLIITMDEPEHGFIPGWGKNHMGGNSAGPVFREIGRRSLEYLGIPPDDPYGYPVGDPRRDPKKADWILENNQLEELYNKWNKN